jgi:hypothetical protein
MLHPGSGLAAEATDRISYGRNASDGSTGVDQSLAPRPMFIAPAGIASAEQLGGVMADRMTGFDREDGQAL